MLATAPALIILAVLPRIEARILRSGPRGAVFVDAHHEADVKVPLRPADHE